MSTVLIIICSKSPNSNLYKCIESLYKIQIDTDINNYKICIVDSDSDDFTNYLKVNNDFPDIQICYIKNKNYEYGAWKYAQTLYSNYDIYFCIQDSFILINDKINLNMVNDKCAYTFHNKSGYNSHLCIKEMGINLLNNSGLDYLELIDTNFTLAQHSSFIVSNAVMKDIFSTLVNAPINKDGSCSYERNFGLYFLLKNIVTIDLQNYMIKITGNRQ